jgi:ribosomal protein S3AE
MKEYLQKLIEEKELDINHIFKVEGESGLNLITLGIVIEHILISAKKNQQEIRQKLVEIDFANADVKHFFKFLAKYIAL